MVVRLLFTLCLALGFSSGPAPAHAPVVPANGHGLPVVKRSETYRQQVLLARDASVVDVAAFVPQLRLELAYATRQNPTGRVLYDARRAYLRLPVALALRGVQRELGRQGIGLLVFDAYRPYSATLALWQAVRDPAYAAPPSSGSRHNRGAAVDVALVDLQTGKPLRMPTPYDTFSVKAHHGYLGLPAQVIARRELLRAVMTRHGFTALAEEWWHYDYVGWRDFAVMDLPLGVLAAARPRFDVWLQYPPAGRVAVLLPPR